LLGTAAWVCRSYTGLKYASEGRYNAHRFVLDGYPRPDRRDPYAYSETVVVKYAAEIFGKDALAEAYRSSVASGRIPRHDGSA
jgi:hypothetical protein